MNRRRRFAPALATALLVACAATPPRAPTAAGTAAEAPAPRPAADSDEGGLWYAMDQIERQVQSSPRRITDPALNAYLRELVCRLAAEDCRQVRVYPLDVPAFNASMAPNGMTQVWSGLLLRCEDEAQLAFVLGHEIGHFRNRDTLAQWRRLKATDGWASVVGMLSLGLGAGLVGELAALAGYANVMAFSRDQERAADRSGYDTAVAGGYDPSAGAELFEALLAEEQAREKNKPSSVFASHPATKERVARLREFASKAGEHGSERGRAHFLAATRGLRMTWLRSELARRHDAQTLVLLDRLAARSDETAPGELTYARAEVLRRRNRDGDRASAIALYRRAESEPGAPPEAARDLGLALRAAGEPREASAAFGRYLERAPDAGDRAMIEHYQNELATPPTPR